MEMLSAFQLYSTGRMNKINIMVDHLWIDNNRLYFRVLEGKSLNQKYFKKKYKTKVYSISREDIVSIRCRIYF